VPEPLELHEQTIGTTHGLGVAGDALCATILAFGDQPRTFQHGHVLLHGCERHLISRRQLAHRRVGIHHAREDVAPRGVRQCAE
jgi:hypothetical protein